MFSKTIVSNHDKADNRLSNLQNMQSMKSGGGPKSVVSCHRSTSIVVPKTANPVVAKPKKSTSVVSRTVGN